MMKMKSNGTNSEIYERERERERESILCRRQDGGLAMVDLEHSVSETRWWPCNGRSRMKSEELKVELT